VAVPKAQNPSKEQKVFYVWFEACIGYLSASLEWAETQGTPERWKEYWCDPDTRLVQFIGKDNIFFHAIFFPAMTMGQNQPYKLVDELPANEFLNLEGRQFSKSDGWYIDLEEVLERYSSDQIRYALAANAPETADAEFTWKDFQLRCNAELLGKYGNLANRVLVFAQRQCKGKIPPTSPSSQADLLFLKEIERLSHEAFLAYERFSLRRVCLLIMELATLGNVYFDTHKPWVLAKSEESFPTMERIIYHCLECLKALAVISFPLIPTTASHLWKLLGQSSPLSSWTESLATPLPPLQPLPPPHILFTKIEDSQIAEELSKLHSRSASS
jgi:methionyl-tRNA synthetase